MTFVQEPEVKWSPDQMIEVLLNEPDDFLKVRETLTRIGVASRKDKKLFQLNEEQVLPLGSGKSPELDTPRPGDIVLALYPLTTTFYRAGVVSHNATTESLGVRFDGDELDENGQLLIKGVPLYFVADKLA